MLPPSLKIFPSRSMALDFAERTVLLVLFGAMAWRFLQDWIVSGNPLGPILLLSEGSVILFLVIRRFAAEITMRPLDWAAAALGTALPLLAKPSGAEPLAPLALCLAMMMGGFALQVAAKLTLRRSFGVVAANRGVKAGGPYRLVRHPMYAGYLLTQAGFLLGDPNAFNAAIYAAAVGFQIQRILAEESLLSRDPAYRALTEKVRYRLVPGVF